MSYEIPHQQNEGSKKPSFLDHVREVAAKEEINVREKYGVPQELEIRKINHEWRFSKAPYQLVEVWRKEQDEYKKDIDNLYSNDDDKVDLYHQK